MGHCSMREGESLKRFLNGNHSSFYSHSQNPQVSPTHSPIHCKQIHAEEESSTSKYSSHMLTTKCLEYTLGILQCTEQIGICATWMITIVTKWSQHAHPGSLHECVWDPYTCSVLELLPTWHHRLWMTPPPERQALGFTHHHAIKPKHTHVLYNSMTTETQ